MSSLYKITKHTRDLILAPLTLKLVVFSQGHSASPEVGNSFSCDCLWGACFDFMYFKVLHRIT